MAANYSSPLSNSYKVLTNMLLKLIKDKESESTKRNTKKAREFVFKICFDSYTSF